MLEFYPTAPQCRNRKVLDQMKGKEKMRKGKRKDLRDPQEKSSSSQDPNMNRGLTSVSHSKNSFFHLRDFWEMNTKGNEKNKKGREKGNSCRDPKKRKREKGSNRSEEIGELRVRLIPPRSNKPPHFLLNFRKKKEEREEKEGTRTVRRGQERERREEDEERR